AARRHLTRGELVPSLERLGRSLALGPRAVLEEVAQGLPALLGYARYRPSDADSTADPGRGHFRLVRLAYRIIARSPLAPLLRSKLVQRLKRELVKIPAELVSPVMKTLDEAGIRAWLAGGWGIDALLGEETRRHLDLDIAFLEEGHSESRAVDALHARGFQFVKREANPGRWLGERIVLSDDAGHLLELLPISLSEGSVVVQAGEETLTFAASEAFTTGTVDGETVPCLSASLQATLHHGYESTENDRRDMALLCARFNLPPPAGFEATHSSGAQRPREAA